MALDVVRAATRAPEVSAAVLEQIKRKVQRVSPEAASLMIEFEQNSSEQNARRMTELLARMAAVAALADIDAEFGQAYARTRMGNSHWSIWGAHALGHLEERLLQFVLP
jgi:putative acyl-CoA dehydrogenase